MILSLSSSALAQEEADVLSDPGAEVADAPPAETVTAETVTAETVPAPSAAREDVEPVPVAPSTPDREASGERLSAPLSPAPSEPQEAVESPPLTATLEVSIGISPSLGFGGLGGLGGSAGLAGLVAGVSGRTDFVFAVSTRVFLGLGLRVAHWENEDDRLASVNVPLIAQVYLDTPRRGEATPTLRFVPALLWTTNSTAVDPPSERLGGSFVLGVGVTWFATEWLAVRLLGNIGGGVNVAYAGPGEVNAFASIGGDVGVVMRL